MDDASSKRIRHRRRNGADTADVVHQKSVVAYRQAGVENRVENVAFLDAERCVSCGVVARAWQHVGRAAHSAGCGCAVVCGASDARGGIALGGGGIANGHVAVGTFSIIRHAACDSRVIQLLVHGAGDGGATLHRPRPAVHAAVAWICEVVQGHKFLRKCVVIGRHAFRELRQLRVAIGAVVQVTQHLVKSAVFFDNVDHMLDFALHEFHGRHVALYGRHVVVVDGDARCQGQKVSCSGHRRAHQRGLLKLELVLIGGACIVGHSGGGTSEGSGVASQVAWIGAGHAFGVDNEHAAAISAEGHIARFIAGRNQATDRACRCARHGNHGDVVCACVDSVECFFIGRKRHSKCACPGLLVASK